MIIAKMVCLGLEPMIVFCMSCDMCYPIRVYHFKVELLLYSEISILPSVK